MSKRLPILLLLCLCFSLSFAQAPNHVVISQVYGGGGNTNAPFKHDFVELYNPTNAAVSLEGWSLQYASAAGNFSEANLVLLSGSIEPGKYFLVRLSGGTNGEDLPTPDLSSDKINIAVNGGKLALVAAKDPLSGCAGVSVVDLVGFGSSTSCNEGGTENYAPSTTAATALHRYDNGCKDTDNNKADFFTQGPSPRNKNAQGHFCYVDINAANLPAQPICIDALTGFAGTVTYLSNTALTGTLNVYLSDAGGNFTNPKLIGSTTATGNSGTINIAVPANLPSGTAYRLRIDAGTMQVYGHASTSFEIINGAKNVSGIYFSPEPSNVTVHWTNPVGCYDEVMIVGKQHAAVTGLPSGNGTAYTANLDFSSNGTAFDGGKVLYKGLESGQVVSGLSEGELYHITIFTRRGTNWSEGLTASVKPRQLPNPGDVVINQFNPGFANANNEFIELVNNTANSIDLSELAIRYQSASSGNLGVAGGTLSGTLPPFSYWLLTSNTGTPTAETIDIGKTQNLQRDGGFSPGFAASAGQVALVRTTDNLVLDALRYGNVTAGTFVEGPAVAAPTANSGYKRKADGVDQNNNLQDFEAVSTSDIDLRNSKSRLAKEGAVIGGGDLARIYVTGNAQLAIPAALSEKLVLQGGRLALGNNDLITHTIEGGTIGSYVQTNGTGKLTLRNVGTGPVLIPIGNATYNPLQLSNGSGLNWQVHLSDGVQAANAFVAVQRTWDIAPSATPTTGANIRFYYNESDHTQLGPLFDKEGKLQVYNHHSGSWQKAGAEHEAGGAPGGMRWAEVTGWTQFSPFVVSAAGEQGALPIHFTGVRLYSQGGGHVLEFTVHNETSVDHYDVETSADGQTWERRALLMPRNNRGATERYEFFDGRPLVGSRYYRIRGVEQTGEVSFSAVLKTTGKVQAPALQVAPNPVVGRSLQYTVSNLAGGSYNIRVYNTVGQVVFQERLVHPGGWVNAQLLLPELKSGWYIIELAGPQPMKQTFLIR